MEQKENSNDEFPSYTYYNKKTERRIFRPIYVVHNNQDLKNVFEYLTLLIKYLEKKILYFKQLNFFYYEIGRLRLRSFIITRIKNYANKSLVSSYEEELMDVVKNIDFLSSKYNAYHLAYPNRFVNPDDFEKWTNQKNAKNTKTFGSHEDANQL